MLSAESGKEYFHIKLYRNSNPRTGMWKIYLINKEGALEVITIVHGKTHQTSYKGCHKDIVQLYMANKTGWGER